MENESLYTEFMIPYKERTIQIEECRSFIDLSYMVKSNGVFEVSNNISQLLHVSKGSPC